MHRPHHDTRELWTNRGGLRGTGGTLEGWNVDRKGKTCQDGRGVDGSPTPMSAVPRATARHGTSNGGFFFPTQSPFPLIASSPVHFPAVWHSLGDTRHAVCAVCAVTLEGHLQWCPTNLAWHVEDTSMDSLIGRNVRVQLNGEMRPFQSFQSHWPMAQQCSAVSLVACPGFPEPSIN